MINKERGEFELQITSDKKVTLRLTTNACAEVEDYCGQSLDEILAGINRGSVNSVRILLWASLRDRHPEIATDEVIVEFYDGQKWVKALPSFKLRPEARTRVSRPALLAIGDLIDEAGGLTGVNAQVRLFMKQNSGEEPSGDRPSESDAEVPPSSDAEVPPSSDAGDAGNGAMPTQTPSPSV